MMPIPSPAPAARFRCWRLSASAFWRVELPPLCVPGSGVESSSPAGEERSPAGPQPRLRYPGIAHLMVQLAVRRPMRIDPDRLKRSWPSLLIVAGFVLLLYVASQYATMYAAQRRLTQEWQEQNLQLPTHPAGLVTTLTRLTIPSIKLDAVVVEGVNRKDLLVGPGHLPETPEPGEHGNAVISGHRDTFFRHIHELKKGDYIMVERSGRRFRYEV